MRRIAGLLAVLYACLLTWFLVAPDPFVIFGSAARSTRTFTERTLAGGLQHAGGYVIFTGLWILATRSRRSRLAVIMLAVLHGAATELLQAFVPERECNGWDLLANVAGVVTGGGLAWLADHRFRNRAGSRREPTLTGESSSGSRRPSESDPVELRP